MIVTLITLPHRCAADRVELGQNGAPPPIVVTRGSPIVVAARDRLAEYLKLLTGTAPEMVAAVDQAPRAVVIGDASLAKEYGIDPPDEPREEAFSIGPGHGGSLLIISGRSDQGMKQGIYHVLRNLSLDNEKVVVRNVPYRSAPVIKLRVSHIGGAMPQKATADQLDWNMIARWQPQRIGNYIDMLDFFGYNSIEEPPTFYVPSDKSDVMLERRKTLREHLLRNGMTGVAKIDGTLLGKGNYTTNPPYGADTKEQYEKYYREMAETAAPYNDIVLTHWVDPGGWPATAEHPCTIEMLQDLHMQIVEQFRRVNPDIKSILSLWNMQNPSYKRWLGYDGVETILTSAKIPKEVGFTQSRIYRAEEAQKILASGHPLGIWGWYTADNELTYTMHVHTHQLRAAMDALPVDAGEKVWFYSMDNCQREFNIYSTYVAGQLLWNPKGDPEVFLREISRLIYGPKLVEPIFRALKAIADVRCGNNCRGYFNPRGGVSLDDGLKQATGAWNGLKDVTIDPHYIAPIKFHRPSDVLLQELKDQTQAVTTYMQFLKDHKTEVPAAPGPFEYYERIQYLQNRSATAPN